MSHLVIQRKSSEDSVILDVTVFSSVDIGLCIKDHEVVCSKSFEMNWPLTYKRLSRRIQIDDYWCTRLGANWFQCGPKTTTYKTDDPKRCNDRPDVTIF